ncbi:MAG: nuclear transport factor 2 family protein [Sphingobium sp.]
MTGNDARATSKSAIEGFLAAFRARDAAGQFARMHPDVEIQEPDSLPYGGVWRGHEGWRALSLAILANFDLGINPDGHRLIGDAEGEDFVLMTRLVGTWRDTGRALDVRILEYWRVVDGLIVTIRPHYFDTAAVVGWEKG